MEGMREYAIGYTAHHIEKALIELGLDGFSTERIRSYAKKNGLTLLYQAKSKIFSGTRFLIPDKNLEALIKGMNIPVNADDLYDTLQRDLGP